MTHALERGTDASDPGGLHDLCAPRQTPPSGVWQRDAGCSEAQLVRRMTQREEAAWREFLQRYGVLVRSVIERTTRRFPALVSSWEVEEIYAAFLQSLLGRDMHRLRVFDAERGTRLSTWVGLLATNATWDHVRRAARRRQCAPKEGEAGSHGPDPLDELLDKEAVLRVRSALGGLSPRDREFVDMYYVRGLSPERIGSELKISVKTVYSKKHKITLRLQSRLCARN